MPEVIYFVAQSVDGFIATPDGGIGWLAPFEGAGEDYGYSAFYASVDAVLVGRRTYEQSLTFGEWPYPGKPVWVFSRAPRDPGRPDVTVTDRAPADVLADLDARGVRRAWLVGGGELAGAFHRERLITGCVISIVPVVLGAGVPLFGAGGGSEALALAGAHTYASGIVQLRYHRADSPAT